MLCTVPVRTETLPSTSYIQKDWIRKGVAHPLGEFIAAVFTHGIIQILEQQPSGKCHVMHTLNDPQHRIFCVALNPSGTSIAAGCEDGQILIWEQENTLSRNWKRVDSFNGHTEIITSIVFSKNLLITAGEDFKTYVWKKRTVFIKSTVTAYEVTEPPAMEFDSDSLASRWEKSATLCGHHHLVTSIAFDPQSNFILTGSYDGSARGWSEGVSKQWPQKFGLKTDSDNVYSVVLGPNATFFALGRRNSSTVPIYTQSPSGGWNYSTSLKHGGELYHVAMDALGKYLVTSFSSDQYTTRIWHQKTPGQWAPFFSWSQPVFVSSITLGSSGLCMLGLLNGTTHIFSWNEEDLLKKPKPCSTSPQCFEVLKKTLYSDKKNRQSQQKIYKAVVFFALVYFSYLANGWLKDLLGNSPKTTPLDFFCKV